MIKLSQKPESTKIDKDGNSSLIWKNGDKVSAWYVKDGDLHPEGVVLDFFISKKREVSLVLTQRDLNDLTALILERNEPSTV